MKTEIKTQLIQNCETFEELYKAFDFLETVQGTQKEYTAERLKEKVEQLKLLIDFATDSDTLQLHRIPWNNITRTHGIRAKVMELFFYEINEI